MKNITHLPIWEKLFAHQQEIAQQHLRDWFAADSARFQDFSLEVGGLFLDYSRQRVNQQTLSLLCQLAHDVDLSKQIQALIQGQLVNVSEKRPALHMALRDPQAAPIMIAGQNVATLIAAMRQQMATFVDAIQSGKWRGVTGKTITHVVNIGIGGSHQGPQMCVYALKAFAINNLQFHFISTVDKTPLMEVLQQIDPERTLFIVSSKSFSTLETMTNANTIAAWMKEKVGAKAIAHHFVAVTGATEKALAFGIKKENIFPLWDWVGGRYSIWSAIGLPLMLMIGKTQFTDFLQGAYEMDQHFQQAPFTENMPVLLALLGIWCINFFDSRMHAVVPYSHALKYFVSYLQQMEMESNGKSIHALHGNSLPYTTSPIIFGEEGCNGQHTYHQLLHQGQHSVPVDFILVGQTSALPDAHHDILMASALSQADALMRGKTYEEAYAELRAQPMTEAEAKNLAHHQVIPGNRPANVLFIENMTPKNLGALLALYEHKIFVQGAIWGINSFDQWGVELGKQLLLPILQQIKMTAHKNHHSQTNNLITYLQAKKNK